MRVNEIIARVSEDTMLQIKDVSRGTELNGFKKDIVENDGFKELKLGNLLVTNIYLKVMHDDPFALPVMQIFAEE